MADSNGQRLFFCSDYTAQLTDRVFNATLFFRNWFSPMSAEPIAKCPFDPQHLIPGPRDSEDRVVREHGRRGSRVEEAVLHRRQGDVEQGARAPALDLGHRADRTRLVEQHHLVAAHAEDLAGDVLRLGRGESDGQLGDLVGSMPFPVLEGQSIGIIPPGADALGKPHHARQYSVASPRNGERPGYNNLALTVKRVTVDHDGNPVRGVASNYVCDLKVGDKVQVVGPFGSSFLMPNHPRSHIVMICTGTGSAPMREVCGLDYGFAAPDDGPAFFSLCIVAFPLTFFIVWLQVAYNPPLWVHLVTSAPLMAIGCVLPLRPIKGWLVASQYVNKAHEAGTAQLWGLLNGRTLGQATGPKYRAIADAIAAAIDRGTLRHGDRLPAQRDVAAQLGVDLTTVTKAYDMARTRGHIAARGRAGSFVLAREVASSSEAPAIDTAMNMPPELDDGLLGQAMIAATTALLGAAAMPALHYQLSGGAPQARGAGAALLTGLGMPTDDEQVIVTAGGQNALHAIVSATLSPGDVVACGRHVYPGFTALARRLGLRLVPLAALDAEHMTMACHEQRVRALYVVPTNDNPTTMTVSGDERKALAEVAARHGVIIIEDDAYGALARNPVATFAALAPDTSWHIA
eukprot:gene33142-44362_t